MMRPFRTYLLAVAAMAVAALPALAQSMPGTDEAALTGFGGAVAVADGDILVGEAENVARPGLVYVYRNVGGTWTEVARLTASEPEMGDGFGASLAADGTTLLVGGAGEVRAFEKSGEAWAERGALMAADLVEGDAFGAAVALQGDLALVGAPGQGEGSGAVYVFRREGSSWSEAGKITLEDGSEEGLLGAAIGLHGNRALIGAPGANERMGSVVAYDIDAMTGAATRTATLAFDAGRGRRGRQAEAPAPTWGFGSSIVVRGDRALVGAPGVAQGMGAVFVLRHTVDAWEAESRLTPFASSGQDAFGAAVALAGDDVWVGAPNGGSVYVFHPAAGGFGYGSAELVVPPGGPEGSFGATLALGEGVAAFGIPRAGRGAGEVAIFEEGSGTWAEARRVMSEEDNFPRVVGGEVECTEGEATAFGCGEVDLVAFMPNSDLGADRGVGTNDVWGWTDPETGREYALVGLRNQASFVDISDPANPVLVGELDLSEGAQPSVWRDIKTYRDHAFIVADGAGQHGMQVFDLTRLREFSGEPIQFDEDAHYDRIASAHNIVINTETGYAFAVGASSGGETCGGGLHMIDIRDPQNPTFAGCFSDPQTGRSGTGYTHDAQCVTYEGPDGDFQGREICFGANETALSIADVTDKANPVALARASYPNVGYTHQGWLTEDQRYFYMNDELDEIQGGTEATRTLIWDVSDLEDPQLVGEYLGTSSSSDHNLYVVGDRMYQSNYRSGLRILDVSDPENPREVAYFDTVPYGENTAGMGGSWSNYPFFGSGVVIVTSGREGLFIVRPRDARTIS